MPSDFTWLTEPKNDSLLGADVRSIPVGSTYESGKRGSFPPGQPALKKASPATLAGGATWADLVIRVRLAEAPVTGNFSRARL
jgi:hypothetical protein